MVWKGAELSKDPMTLSRRFTDFNHILAIVPWGTLYKLLHSVQTAANTENAAEGLLRMLLRVYWECCWESTGDAAENTVGCAVESAAKGGFEGDIALETVAGTTDAMLLWPTVNRMLLVTAAHSLLGTVAESARTAADSLMDILLRIIGGYYTCSPHTAL